MKAEEVMPDSKEFVIAFQGNSPAEAELVRTLLEGNGVPAVIPDRYNPLPGVDLTPLDKAGGAGCDVMVARRDLERAREILVEARSTPLDEEEIGAEEPDTGEGEEGETGEGEEGETGDD